MFSLFRPNTKDEVRKKDRKPSKKVAPKKVSATTKRTESQKIKDEKAQIREVLRDIKAVQRKMKRTRSIATNGEAQSAVYIEIIYVAEDIAKMW